MNHATTTPVAAIVALTRPALPKQKPFVAELRRRLQDNSIADDLAKPSPDLLTFGLGEETVSLTLVRQPVPWNELEEPCLASWWWPEADASMQSHNSYLQITLAGQSSTPLERFILLTHIAASAVVAVDAAGVFWPTGRVVHEPKAFAEYSEGVSPADIVPQLWFETRIAPNDDGTFGLYTTGLAALGLPEIEIDRSQYDPEDLMALCQDILSHVVTAEEPIQAGESLGFMENDQITVEYAPSRYGRGTVMKLRFE
jgi:hypothetical protein